MFTCQLHRPQSVDAAQKCFRIRFILVTQGAQEVEVTMKPERTEVGLYLAWPSEETCHGALATAYDCWEITLLKPI
ncbi:hypothetical protein E2C01_050123 [Portunus trituberculatus]|uniref:Uncharacterized protein n=1 Tax=Portunus trituberculatus TaxID=210409 RepID=A0A5B7G7E8_PORTR|nr:hypothetical protein [Portunus trituberculatus]